MPRHRGKGRRKAEMKPIEKPEACQVCFSKRRQGLFKKASELSVLCGAQVGALVFSPAGRAYSFGSPSVDAVVDHYLSGTAGPLPTPRAASAVGAAQEPRVGRVEEELMLPRLWDADIEGLGLEELREYEEALVELQGEIGTRTLQAFAINATTIEGQQPDDLAEMDEQPPSSEATSDSEDAAADLASLAEASDPGQVADGDSSNKKYDWLSLWD